MHKIHDNQGSTFRTRTTAVHIEQHMHKERGKLCMTELSAINPGSFSPFPKNPKITAFLREVGRADKAGLGARNIFKYTPIYSKDVKPELINGDILKIIIPIAENNEKEIETTLKTVKNVKARQQIS